MLISDVVRSCKAISQNVSLGRLSLRKDDGANIAPQDGTTSTLKEMANQVFLHHCEWGGHLAAISSAEMNDIYTPDMDGRRGNYLLLFDALDGSSNIDINLSVGSIFSVLRCPRHGEASAEDFLPTRNATSGRRLRPVRCIHDSGPDNRHRNARDSRSTARSGEFLLTHPNLRILRKPTIFRSMHPKNAFGNRSAAMSRNAWPDRQGVHAKDFNMRWAATMVADAVF